MSVTEARLLHEALQALHINVPIWDFKIKGNTITLWLYGHYKPVKYTHRPPKPAPETHRGKDTKTKAKRAAA